MKTLFITAFVLLFGISNAQNNYNMKLNAGIITEKIAETKKFYTEVLEFGVSFENEFYLLLHTPNQTSEISFLLPNHPSQKPIFQSESRSVALAPCRLARSVRRSFSSMIAARSSGDDGSQMPVTASRLLVTTRKAWENAHNGLGYGSRLKINTESGL